jgi:hypothetical protein
MRALAMLLCVLAVAGCSASETGNPLSGRTLTLRARSSDPVVGIGAGADAALRVEAAWVVLDDIRFESAAQCDSGETREADIEGPIIVDLVQRPEPLALALQDTAYCRVRVPLDRAERVPSGAPQELQDASIVVMGRRADGARFSIRTRREREAELRSDAAPFEIDDATAALILAFDVGQWLAGVDVEGAEPDEAGVVRIDDDNEDDRLERFEENVEAALELFHDRDEDGALDDDDDPLAR